MRTKEISLIFLLLAGLVAINYSWIDTTLTNSLSDYDFINVDRVIDGDTIESNETSIRLLGINSPEKREKYYQEAKNFLEKEILNKTVRLEYGKDKKDKYGRTLAYVFSANGDNMNIKIVEKGFANYYFPSGKDIYYDDFKKAWETCISNNQNVCAKSKNICANCIELKNLDYNSQEAVFFNKCDFNCNLKNWTIKDEGRKKFVFPDINLKQNKEIKIKVGEGENSDEVLFWKKETYVWTKTGDTLFLRDESNELILWEGY